MSGSEASLLAALAPVSGLPASSWGSKTMFQPSIFLASLASLTARSIEFCMPRPSEASEPVSGPTNPILTVFVSPLPLASPPDSSWLQPAARMTKVPSTATRRRSLWLPLQGTAPFRWDALRHPHRPPGAVDRCQDECRRSQPPSDGRPTAASGQVADGWTLPQDGASDYGPEPIPAGGLARSRRVGDHGPEMTWPRRVPPAAIAAGLLLVALVAVGQLSSAVFPRPHPAPGRACARADDPAAAAVAGDRQGRGDRQPPATHLRLRRGLGDQCQRHRARIDPHPTG